MLAVLHAITLGTHDPHPVYPATEGKTTRTVPKQGQNGADFTNWHTKLRKDLLKGYDVNSPPISNRFPNTDLSMAASISDAGTDVKLQLRVLKLDSIDVSAGSMSVKVWVRMMWQDDRLKWNSSDYGGLHTARFWAHNSDDTEIWVPDITTYNTRGSLADHVGGAWVDVYSSGGTWYSRAGTLEVLCKFQGLVSFPFDKDVRCDLDIGGWMISGAAQGIYLAPGVPGDPSKFKPGVDFLPVMPHWDSSLASSYEVAAERSTGSTYVAYALTAVTANASAIVYGCCPNDPFPIMTYTFQMYRTTQMITVLLLPLGFLTFLVNFAFFMTTDDTNRVVFCMTILLIIMVVKEMTYSLVPLTGELMWIHLYIIYCEFIVMFITLQSFLVFFLSRYKGAFLFPSILMVYIFCTTKSFRRFAAGDGGGTAVAPESSASANKPGRRPTAKSKGKVADSSAAGVGEGRQPVTLEKAAKNNDFISDVVNKSIARRTNKLDALTLSVDVSRKKGLRASDLLEDDMMHHVTAVDGANPPNHAPTQPWMAATGENDDIIPSKAMRLLKWEKIFYQIDNDLRGYLHEEEALAFYTFIRLDLSKAEVEEKATRFGGDQMLVLSEFIEVSEILLREVSKELVEAGFENFMSCREMIQMRHNRRWRALSLRIDDWCRIWVPTLYITCLALVFNISFDDGYGPDKNGIVKSRVIFTGLPPVIEVENGFTGVLRILALPVVLATLGPMFFCARQLLMITLTKGEGKSYLNKSFTLKPNYTWVERLPKSWQWLLSTAHVENKQNSPDWGPRYTAGDLDRIIGYKIYPDSRTRQVESHKAAVEAATRPRHVAAITIGARWRGHKVRHGDVEVKAETPAPAAVVALDAPAEKDDAAN